MIARTQLELILAPKNKTKELIHNFNLSKDNFMIEVQYLMDGSFLQNKSLVKLV
jgi:hypothetical protein